MPGEIHTLVRTSLPFSLDTTGMSKDSFATSNRCNSHENLSPSPTSYARSSRKILSTSLPQNAVGVVPDLVGAFVGIEVGCKERD